MNSFKCNQRKYEKKNLPKTNRNKRKESKKQIRKMLKMKYLAKEKFCAKEMRNREK